MSRHVFKPLHMTSTAPDRNDSLIPNRTRFYERDSSGHFLPAPTVDNSYKWAGGGFLSTAEDMVRFGSAHLKPGYLKAATLELLFTPQHTTSGETTRIRPWSMPRHSARPLRAATSMKATSSARGGTPGRPPSRPPS